MITLYHFGPFYTLPDPSPFCLKVDAYLRAAGIAFETRAGLQYMRKAPKGKLPYIEDDGQVIADSAFILEHLKRKYGDPLDGALTPEQRATSHAFIKMMDENLYWCVVHSRWIDPALWPTIRHSFFGAMPLPARIMVPVLAQRQVKQALHMHGLGRHSAEDILGIAKRDLTALSDFLGEKEYFHGAGPTTLDTTAYGFLAGIIIPPFQCALSDAARGYPNLVRFVERFRERYYQN